MQGCLTFFLCALHFMSGYPCGSCMQLLHNQVSGHCLQSGREGNQASCYWPDFGRVRLPESDLQFAIAEGTMQVCTGGACAS